jgi:hypothetical protein
MYNNVSNLFVEIRSQDKYQFLSQPLPRMSKDWTHTAEGLLECINQRQLLKGGGVAERPNFAPRILASRTIVG